MYLCGDQTTGQFSDQLLMIGDGKFPNDDVVDVVVTDVVHAATWDCGYLRK